MSKKDLRSSNPKKELIEIGPNFWNIRARFVIKMLIDIGNQMSIIRLSNGNFLVIDAVPLTDNIKKEIDELTENGSKIEAVLATHPFHTVGIPSFYANYPKASYYGCPRHLRKLTMVQWAGDLNECKIRSLWEPDVELRIPAGSEFVAPVPESTNHFSCVWVFHKASRTIHIDDTVFYAQDPGFLLSLGGFKKGSMSFHPSMTSSGLLPHPDSPSQFRDWVATVLKDWDFDNIVAAHTGNKLGGAKTQLQELLTNSEPLFKELSGKKLRNSSAELPGSPENALTNKDNECG